MKLIKNGSAFPKSVKIAALAAWVGSTRSAAVIATEYNTCESTITRWIGEAGVQRGTQHPNLKAAVARRIASIATTKAFVTPTPSTVAGNKVIKYKGEIYSL